MTIRKGESWGEPGVLELDADLAASDAELAALLQRYYEAQQIPPVIGLLAGSLHRTLGSPQRDERSLRSGDGYVFPIDLGLLQFQDAQGNQKESVFVAHLVAYTDYRLNLWRKRTVIVMNAAFVEDLNLGPRAHPNDGRLDVTEGQLGFKQRKQAYRRAAGGAHLPHPDLTETRVGTSL
ncbi:MAG: hypothetical protein WD029_06805, partial [Microthrixaceae bacterium]